MLSSYIIYNYLSISNIYTLYAIRYTYTLYDRYTNDIPPHRHTHLDSLERGRRLAGDEQTHDTHEGPS